MLRFYVSMYLLAAILATVTTFDYSTFPDECSSIQGRITCENGTSSIEKNAKIVLREKNSNATDNFIFEFSPNGTIFKFEGCVNPPQTTGQGVYLEFYNVCEPGDYHLSGTVRENFVYYTLKDGNKSVDATTTAQ